MMHVLMQIRQNVFDLPGGDTIQMLRTKEALERRGVQVDISTDLRPNLRGYDLVHLFNLTRVQETYLQAEHAKKDDLPIVLSTIYWPFQEYEKVATSGLRALISRGMGVDGVERAKAFAKYVTGRERSEGTRRLITASYTQSQREILYAADHFLPNAATEMTKIEEVLGFSTSAYTVVPNAVDTCAIENATTSCGDEFDRYKGWLVCVGRIDARKNQLALLEAVRGTSYKLLLVGRQSPGHKKYYAQVMDEVNRNSNVEHLESLPNGQLYNLFKQCAVSILPSWFETPGLVSLEAAAMGCRVVVSPKGTTRDYFGDDAFYCDVSSPDSIRQAIDLAFEAPASETLRERILTEYTWDMAAQKTLDGYQKALAK